MGCRSSCPRNTGLGMELLLLALLPGDVSTEQRSTSVPLPHFFLLSPFSFSFFFIFIVFFYFFIFPGPNFSPVEANASAN